MFELLERLPWPLGATFIISIFVAGSSISILLIRHFVNPKSLQGHHDVASVVFANLGVLYSVLLGFTVVNAQQRFDQTNTITEIEASHVMQLYLDSSVFPDPERSEIQRALKSYAHSVVNEEWELMKQGLPSTSTAQKFRAIWQAYYALEPKSTQQNAWYAQSIDQLNQLMKSRIERLLGNLESISSEMWTLLISGGIMLIIFLGFFGLANPWTHLLLGATMASTIAFMLFLIYSVDTAFSGSYAIPPESMSKALGLLP